MKDLRSGGDAAADQPYDNQNNCSLQELASAGPSALESFGPEPGGPIVRADIERHGFPTRTFKLRCGLVAREVNRE
jgi:hypothetical protein